MVNRLTKLVRRIVELNVPRWRPHPNTLFLAIFTENQRTYAASLVYIKATHPTRAHRKQTNTYSMTKNNLFSQSRLNLYLWYTMKRKLWLFEASASSSSCVFPPRRFFSSVMNQRTDHNVWKSTVVTFTFTRSIEYWFTYRKRSEKKGAVGIIWTLQSPQVYDFQMCEGIGQRASDDSWWKLIWDAHPCKKLKKNTFTGEGESNTFEYKKGNIKSYNYVIDKSKKGANRGFPTSCNCICYSII